ncbi:MAG: serine hydrolase [Dehalococcoidales bacterium]|nr:serine hydrolase [Dehalococcoidales bacterium]
MKNIFLTLVMVLMLVAAGCGCPSGSTTAPADTVSYTTPAAAPSETAPATGPAPSTAASATPPPQTTVVTTPAATTPAVEAGTLKQRLDLLVKQMEQKREILHIPGMALAVVRDSEVVLARGFGVRDLENNTPVTPETVFPVGSVTKSFTSTLVGMMVDEGKMSWDDPVSRFLPYFQLKIQTSDPQEKLTLVDVLSHRSGFPRMGILTASSKVPIEEVLRDASAAEPYAPFRERFYYSNEVYMSAGVAAAEAAGAGWAALLKQRILDPLEMNDTTASYAEVLENPDLSRGYLWDEDIDQYVLKPLRNVDNIAPAGAINSTILDMARWLQFQLGGGRYQEKRLISQDSLDRTHRSFIQMVPGIDYGLGWMVRSWKDKTIVEHGGNVDGFSAQMAMVPEYGVGFVLLTNTSVNALQEQSITMVLEALLGEWRGEDSVKAEQYEAYLGAYVANFGSFKETEFNVLVQNNHLAVDIPGQMVYELDDPDTEGKWYFRISDQIAVSFQEDENGEVTGMRLHQAGLDFEIPKKGYETAPEIPLADLQKYLGSYHSEQLNITNVVKIQNNRLAIDIPGQMVYELYPPDEEGRWYFRVTDAISLSFHEEADGKVDRLTMYQGGLEFVMERVEGIALPSVEEIMELRRAAGREAAFSKLGTIRLDYGVYVEQSGVKGSMSLYAGEEGLYRIDEDFGKYGAASVASDGEHVRIDSDFNPFEDLHGKRLQYALLSHPITTWGDWRENYDTIRVVRRDTLEDKTVFVVEMTQGDLPLTTVYLDSSTGDILMSESYSIQEGGINIPIKTIFEDYREVNGLRLASREVSSNEQSGRVISTFNKMEVNVKTTGDFFTLTPPAGG